MAQMRKFAALASAVVCAVCALAGCAARETLGAARALTPDEVERNGTRTFPGSAERVFDATLGALTAEGYRVARSDAAAGLITTAPKLVRTESTGSAEENPTGYTTDATTIRYTRLYIVRVRDLHSGRVEVRAEPRVFAGAQDVSAQPVWDLDSAMGERALWGRLFVDVARELRL